MRYNRAGLLALAAFIELFVSASAQAQEAPAPTPVAEPAAEAPAPEAPAAETPAPEAPAKEALPPAEEPAADLSMYDDLDTIVVTGVTRSGATYFQSSVSVSDLSDEEIKDISPRTTAEVFRNIPGVRSESSGGENNANIQVRGIPVTTGGAKFVQLQEDGLPVLSFGDITFGNADNFLRMDSTVQRIEAIRGGSSSTVASNAPGAVINFISKTGEVEGGSLGVTRGLDFDTTRLDFEYGSPLGDDMTFHVGGFFRSGEGARETGFNSESGGQVKANLTKNFRNGHVRVYFKHLDDRVVPYLPAPAQMVDGKPTAIEGFDGRTQTLSSKYLLQNTRVDSGALNVTSIRDGVRVLSTGVGAEAAFDLPQDWKISERFRYSANSGGFVGSFAGGVLDASTVAKANGGTDLVFANGPRAGQTIQNPANLNGNGLLVDNLLFDVQTPDLSQFVSDLKLQRGFDTSVGRFDFSAGYYKSIQQVETAWSFNFFLQEAKGDNPALVDIVDGSGQALTVNGVRDFGIFDPVFDLTFNRDAAYAALVWENDWFTLDNSIRYEHMRGVGTSNVGSPSADVGGFVSQDIDVNGDGTVTPAETGIGTVDPSNLFAVDWAVQYLSWSIGANAAVNDDIALFARYSQGGVANGDRLVLGGTGFNRQGDLIDDGLGIDIAKQAEMGVKARTEDSVIPGYLAGFLTAFYGDTEESNFEITSGRAIDRRTRAFGAELEGAWRTDPFSLTGGITWTDAKIADDNLNPDFVGNRPRRQAAVVYQLTPAVQYLDNSAGLNIVGTTKSYAQDVNDLELPGFAQVNLFANVEITQGLFASLNMNNVFNTWGLTEAEEGTLPDNGIIRARSISGRTTSLSVRYTF